MTRNSRFTVGEAARVLGVDFFPRDVGEVSLPENFRIDSRQVEPGDGFIAIRGARDDGHNYALSAERAGASCILLERDYFNANDMRLAAAGGAFIPVDDTTRAATKLARAWLDEVSPRVIGITGSVGKTTTREFTNVALSRKFRTRAAIKSYNTLIGASLTVLSTPPGTEILILELGTNHPGEIREIVQNFPINDGVITDVAHAHLEGLGGLEGVLAAKMEITESSALKSLSYNIDNELLAAAVPKAFCDYKVTVGYSGEHPFDSFVTIADARQIINDEYEPKLKVELRSPQGRIFCESPLFGRQHAMNIAYAYSVASRMGLSDEAFVSAAAEFKVPRGRGSLTRGKNSGVLIDDTYNANPASMSQAIKNLLEMEAPEKLRRVAVLGGMRELGDASDTLHESMFHLASPLDGIYLIGSEWKETAARHGARLWDSTDDFADYLGSGGVDAFARSAVLLKGSRFYELERLLRYYVEEGRDAD
jgi:UDP-N-acetylmuramoyl-tripeptide--D-alanyl-D-alanine ligase